MAKHALPERLEDYRPSGLMYASTGKYVLFGIDSDGCVDKGMRYKHGGPFPRASIELYKLEPIAEAWRIAWAYVNEIEDRGCPRFQALAMASDRVLEMPTVKEAEALKTVAVPRLPHLKAFLRDIADKKGYGDNVLKEYIASLPPGEEREELGQVIAWSAKVNEYVNSDCPYIRPYSAAVEAIRLAKRLGVDCMIVSGTPEEHLRESWERHGLTNCIRGVFGRESGKKDSHLVGAMRAAERHLGRMYDTAIMFGDAPGDDKERRKASKELGVRIGFVPVRVGREEEDWKWFADTFLASGRLGDYTEEVEAERIRAFEANLRRPWNPNADITMVFGQQGR